MADRARCGGDALVRRVHHPAAPEDLNGFFAFSRSRRGRRSPRIFTTRRCAPWCGVIVDQVHANVEPSAVKPVAFLFLAVRSRIPRSRACSTRSVRAGASVVLGTPDFRRRPERRGNQQATSNTAHSCRRAVHHAPLSSERRGGRGTGRDGLQVSRRDLGRGHRGRRSRSSEQGAHRQWATTVLGRCSPLSVGGAYVNFMMDEATSASRRPTARHYERLAAIKATYDPANYFRVNQNISPPASERWRAMRYDVIIVGARVRRHVLRRALQRGAFALRPAAGGGTGLRQRGAPRAEIADGYTPAYTHDWGYAQRPDRYWHALPLPRAKLVGGCSATNATFALRGASSDYDEWAAQGNAGWAFADVLPFFRLLENVLRRSFGVAWRDGTTANPAIHARRV